MTNEYWEHGYIGYVYALKRNGIIFYVGQTTCAPEWRLSEHKQRFGKNITMMLLQKVKGWYALGSAEQFWIKFYAYDYILENVHHNPRYGALRPRLTNYAMLR